MDNRTGRPLEINPSTLDQIQYTADNGPKFKTLQSKPTNLPPDLCACYPFQGAPDATVHRCAILNELGGRRDSAQSDESN